MRILLVNHSFPGDLGPLLAALAAEPGHEILFASCRGRRDFSLPGVRHVVLSSSRSRRLAGDGAGVTLERALEAGRQALQAFRQLRQSGFVPDMVLLSSALEQGLFLRDAFPDAFVVGFMDNVPDAGLAGDGRGLVRHLLHCRQKEQCDLRIRLTVGEVAAGRPEGRTADGENITGLSAPAAWPDVLFPEGLLPEKGRGVSLPCPVDTRIFSPASVSGEGSGRTAEGTGPLSRSFAPAAADDGAVAIAAGTGQAEKTSLNSVALASGAGQPEAGDATDTALPDAVRRGAAAPAAGHFSSCPCSDAPASGTGEPALPAPGRVICTVRDAADVGRLLRLAEALLAARPEIPLVLLCESTAGREQLAALRPTLPATVEVPERLPLQAYRDLLRGAVCITSPALSCLSAQVLLEAMSCGVVPVLAGEAARWPLLREGGGCLWCGADDLVPTLAAALARPQELARLSRAARATVVRHFRRQDVIPRHLALLRAARAAWLRQRREGAQATS